MAKDKDKKKKKKKFSILEILILLIALGVIGYSGYQLYTIYHGYAGAKREYDGLIDEFVTEADPYGESSESSEADGGSEGGGGTIEYTDADAYNAVDANNVEDEGGEEPDAAEQAASLPAAHGKLKVDFAGLKAINSDIVGWITVDGVPNINYPVCQAANNDYYLRISFRRESWPPGAIFMDYRNYSDYSSACTIIYGHRMDDNSMFGGLYNLKDQANVNANPYIWIYTPTGTKCYQIFAVAEVDMYSDIFAIHNDNDEAFVAWAQKLKSMSVVSTSVDVGLGDKTIMLSTCTTDRVHRVVVGAKLVAES